MSTTLNSFVIYFVAKPKDTQQKAIDDFLTTKESSRVVETFIEITENNRPSKWTQLQKAIECCQQQQATLVVSELGTLSKNDSFVNLLLNADVNFYFCDQPFVNNDILDALNKHSKFERTKHSELIRAGLKNTSAKSGNPNAAEVIGKVNKPKIDAAILFAFLLQPIVTLYKQLGYSQRQMVKSLNEEGFTAPEGGKWVLSQLQKVLDRVKINEAVMQTKPIVESLLENNFTISNIADELNKQQIPAIKKAVWDEGQVNKVLTRLEQIKDIENINKFVLTLLPVIHEFKAKNYSPQQILQNIEKHGIRINNTTAAVYN